MVVVVDEVTLVVGDVVVGVAPIDVVVDWIAVVDDADVAGPTEVSQAEPTKTNEMRRPHRKTDMASKYPNASG